MRYLYFLVPFFLAVALTGNGWAQYSELRGKRLTVDNTYIDTSTLGIAPGVGGTAYINVFGALDTRTSNAQSVTTGGHFYFRTAANVIKAWVNTLTGDFATSAGLRAATLAVGNLQASVNTIVPTNPNGDLNLNHAGTGTVRINAAGASGWTNPAFEIGSSAALEDGGFVTNTNSTNAAFWAVRNGSTAADAFSMIAQGTSYPSTYGYRPDQGILLTGTGLSGGMTLMTRAAAPIYFYTGGYTAGYNRGQITSDGLWSVGTTTPNQTFDINNKFTVAGATGNAKTSGSLTVAGVATFSGEINGNLISRQCSYTSGTTITVPSPIMWLKFGEVKMTDTKGMPPMPGAGSLARVAINYDVTATAAANVSVKIYNLSTAETIWTGALTGETTVSDNKSQVFSIARGDEPFASGAVLIVGLEQAGTSTQFNDVQIAIDAYLN